MKPEHASGTSTAPSMTFSRTRGTSVSFSWRGRLVLSMLPIVPLGVFIWGGLGLGPLTLLFGAMTAIGTALWLPHVWTRARLPGEPAHADSSEAAGDEPIDLFTWPADSRSHEPSGPPTDTAD